MTTRAPGIRNSEHREPTTAAETVDQSRGTGGTTPESGAQTSPDGSVLATIAKLSDLVRLGAQALDDCLARYPRYYAYRQFPTCIEAVHQPAPNGSVTINVDMAGAVLATRYNGLQRLEDGSYRYLRNVSMAPGTTRDVYELTVQDARRQMVITDFEAKRLKVLQDLFNNKLGNVLAKLDPPTWVGTPGPRTREERQRREELADRFVIKPTTDGQALVTRLLAETVPSLKELGL